MCVGLHPAVRKRFAEDRHLASSRPRQFCINRRHVRILLEAKLIIFAKCNKGESNLAKGDITRLVMSYAKHLVDIFYHNGQVAASNAKFVLELHLDPILGKGRWYSYGVSDGTIGKSKGHDGIGSHCDHYDISNHSAGICRRMSQTFKSTRVGQFWAKFWKRLTDVGQILSQGCRMRKKSCRYILPFEQYERM